jgi:hypothetical protein
VTDKVRKQHPLRRFLEDMLDKSTDKQEVVNGDPAHNVPAGTTAVTQNYYQVGFWACLNGAVNAFFTFLLGLTTTANGWMGLIIIYVLWCLITGKKFSQ